MLHQPHVSNKIVPKLNLPQNIVKCKRHRDDDSAKIGHGAIRTREYWQKARNYYRRNQITTRDTHTEIVIRWFPRSHHARAWHLALEAWNGQNDRSPITRPRRRRVGTISYANSFFSGIARSPSCRFQSLLKSFRFPQAPEQQKITRPRVKSMGNTFFENTSRKVVHKRSSFWEMIFQKFLKNHLWLQKFDHCDLRNPLNCSYFRNLGNLITPVVVSVCPCHLQKGPYACLIWASYWQITEHISND